jgi:hypothetical protein
MAPKPRQILDASLETKSEKYEYVDRRRLTATFKDTGIPTGTGTTDRCVGYIWGREKGDDREEQKKGDGSSNFQHLYFHSSTCLEI